MYSRTLYPYQEERLLKTALTTLASQEGELLEKITETQTKLQQESQTLRSIFARAEEGLAFSSRGQAEFVAQVKTPVLEQIVELEHTLAKKLRTQAVFHEALQSFLEAKKYLPFVDNDAEPSRARDRFELLRRKRTIQQLHIAREEYQKALITFEKQVVEMRQVLRGFHVDVLHKVKLMNRLSELVPKPTQQ